VAAQVGTVAVMAGELRPGATGLVMPSAYGDPATC